MSPWYQFAQSQKNCHFQEDALVSKWRRVLISLRENQRSTKDGDDFNNGVFTTLYGVFTTHHNQVFTKHRISDLLCFTLAKWWRLGACFNAKDREEQLLQHKWEELLQPLQHRRGESYWRGVQEQQQLEKTRWDQNWFREEPIPFQLLSNVVGASLCLIKTNLPQQY